MAGGAVLEQPRVLVVRGMLAYVELLRRSETPTSSRWSVCQPWFYLRLWPQPGHTALLGYPRGHRVARETRLKPNPPKDTHPRTQAFPQRSDRRHSLAHGCSWFSAQAACAFSFVGSKRSPFFQSVRAMAAILRASVSCAISGLMPAATRC